MLFQPLGSQQKTALSNNAVTCCQAFEHRKESIALCPESHGPQDEFRRLVGGYEKEHHTPKKRPRPLYTILSSTGKNPLLSVPSLTGRKMNSDGLSAGTKTN